jgi:hypothetical protein
MSDLRPKGIPVVVDGVERRFLFTLNVIDELQEHYDEPLEDIMDGLTEKQSAVRLLRKIVCMLLNDEALREPEKGLKQYTEQETGWLISQETILDYTLAVLKAYGAALPEPEEDEDPNQTGGNGRK